MYEDLTKHLLELEATDSYGTWIVNSKSKGTMDNPSQMPYVNYGRTATAIERAIYAFEESHPEFGSTAIM